MIFQSVSKKNALFFRFFSVQDEKRWKNVRFIVYLLFTDPPPRNSRSTAFTNRIVRVIRGVIAPFGQCS